MNTSTIKITNEILGLIAEIDEFKGSWKAIGRIAPDRLQNLRRIASIESVGSSTRIEGAKLSDLEVKRLLSNLEVKSFSSRDEQEVAGYADAMEMVFNHAEDIILSENHIKQLHRDLLKYSEKDGRHRGEYKTLPNNVEAFDSNGKSIGTVFQTSTPFETPRSMKELIDWLEVSLAEEEMHRLLIIAIFVVTFLAIHPFQDGNGRLSRILTSLLLLKCGYDYVPYSSLESVIERNKKNYYLALRQSQKTIRDESPNWQPWIIFFLKSLKKQKDGLSIKIAQERILLDTLPELSIRILEIARERGRISVGEAVKVLGENRNTLKDHFKNLVKKKFLEKHGAGRGSWYSLNR